MRHLILNLESPMMAFGGQTIDNLGVIRRFPAASMITGMIANALGWRRTDRALHQALQDRLVFASRIDREPAGGFSMQDFQTAALGHADRGWTTRGRPEGRAGGARTYDAPHLRYRDYFSDMLVTVALRLDRNSEHPTLDDVASALDSPARPLFIGRKPCLPSSRLFSGFVEADTALAALIDVPMPGDRVPDSSVSLQWPETESVTIIESTNTQMLTDERNWVSGLHGGGRAVCEGTMPVRKFGEPQGASPDPEEDTQK